MILVSGSWLVRDSGKRNDIDVIYLTWNVGKYLVMLVRKKEIENKLQNKYGVKVSFTPYIVFSPTILGNLFLAITLLRYPFYKPHMEYILKLALRRHDKRWLLLHFAFALLGLISARSSREYAKYCSMISENLLYTENSRIPDSWRDTILVGCAIALKHKLINLSTLLLLCNKYIEGEKELARLLDVNLSRVVSAVNEYFKLIQVKDIRSLDGILAKALRRIHEVIIEYFLKQNVRWRECSLAIMSLIHPRILTYVLRSPIVKKRAIMTFSMCKQQIPVLSPLARP